FPSDRARTPVRALSGGERNRLLLARLFTRSFNVLVLDEPTNDLDIETLDLLEDMLTEFQGTLLVVSHDRAFLDNVVTSTLVFEGDARVNEYVGGYSDWVRQRVTIEAIATSPRSAAAGATKNTSNAATIQPRAEKKKKLSFKEQKELAALPDKIDARETERSKLYASLSDPLFTRDPNALLETTARLSAIEKELAVMTERWETLETIASGS
ncbi:MAG: ATP-binding cassette domain-containing protein, partial [Gemmatimonadaceae bacterium]